MQDEQIDLGTNYTISQKPTQNLFSNKHIKKRLESEMLNVQNQLNQMKIHLEKMEQIYENNSEIFSEPENSIQRNMKYINRYIKPKIKQFYEDMKTFADEAKNIQLNIDAKEFTKLREFYDFVEQKMQEFYQEYKAIYFDMKMYIERYNYYKKDDAEHIIKVIQQLIS